MVERQFRAMGSVIRLWIAPGDDPSLPPPGAMAVTAQAWLVRFEQTLSRFRDDSELSLLNRDPRREVPASPLLREAVRAAVWAAERSDGLVDATLAPEVVAAGYEASRADVESVPLADALAAAPDRHPAAPRPGAPWRSLEVAGDTVSRPPGVQLDAGGIGKGLAADMLAARLAAYPRFVIDCGGDIRLGGRDASASAIEVEVRHPLTGGAAATIELTECAVATSGLDARLWKRADGGFSHHLIDPASGAPAWTGLVGATALAPTAVEAETLAKAAILSGPEGSGRFISDYGGFVIDEAGRVERVCGQLLP
jgi:thiamine biosynthesis lipoprotein